MKIKVIILYLMMSLGAYAQDLKENKDIENLFVDAGVNGTFALYDPLKKEYVGHNGARANTRHIPASSYKIAHTLIGLAVGAVSDVDEILPYGGKPAYLKIWEKNMSLRDAIKISNVPIYQALSRRIGIETMKKGLKRLQYGNMQVGDIVDQFWLGGPLEISAFEQITFLNKLAREELPFLKIHQQQVKEITVNEETDDYILHAKSGLTNASDPGIGWWVGWVNRDGTIYPFALNIDILGEQYAAKREELARAALSKLGLI
jgi:beta-lactamase class D